VAEAAAANEERVSEPVEQGARARGAGVCACGAARGSGGICVGGWLGACGSDGGRGFGGDFAGGEEKKRKEPEPVVEEEEEFEIIEGDWVPREED